MHVAIPVTTRALMVLGELTRHYWFLTPVVVAGTWLLVRLIAAQEPGAAALDRVKLSLPMVGNLARRINLARVAMALGTALKGGVPLVEALDTAIQVTENRVLRQALSEVKQSITEGLSVADALRQAREFPALVRQMAAAGERSGELAEMLLRLSAYYSREADAEIKALTAVIEPVLIVAMGAVVGLIAVSIISPIYSVIGALK